MDDHDASLKGNRRTAMLILGGVVLVGVLVAGVFVGGPMRSRAGSQTQAASPAGSLDPKEALQAFAQCMRDNGLANFPDPVGEKISLSGTDLDPKSAAFQTAHEACVSLLPRP